MSLVISIFNKDNHSDYMRLILNMNLNLDIYYYPVYLDIDAKMQGGTYEIFTVADGKSIFIYPYIKLPFVKLGWDKYFDITSPYGYCGPYCEDAVLFKIAEQEFIKYISTYCVTEFVRYHYQYNVNLKFTEQITNIKNRTIVVLNTNQPWETIWEKEFSSTNRNLVRKLEKENFKYELTREANDLADFIKMYYDTMTNAGASHFYYFNSSFFQELFKKLGEKIVLTKVTKDNIVYCYSLFFISGSIGTYYLSARNLEHFKVPSTNFLLSNTVKWLQTQNVKTINLGGGLTDNLNDPLFKFKSNFSKDHTEFYIGKRIHNIEIYNSIVEDWILQNGRDDYFSRKNILQFYR